MADTDDTTDSDDQQAAAFTTAVTITATAHAVHPEGAEVPDETEEGR